jgi:hypothetical protein
LQKIYSNLASRQVGNDLTKYSFIGFKEYYNQSVERFCNILQVDIPKGDKKFKVVGEGKYKPTTDECKIIKDLNKKDYELYDEALRLWKYKK